MLRLIWQLLRQMLAPCQSIHTPVHNVCWNCVAGTAVCDREGPERKGQRQLRRLHDRAASEDQREGKVHVPHHARA